MKVIFVLMRSLLLFMILRTEVSVAETGASRTDEKASAEYVYKVAQDRIKEERDKLEAMDKNLKEVDKQLEELNKDLSVMKERADRTRGGAQGIIASSSYWYYAQLQAARDNEVKQSSDKVQDAIKKKDDLVKQRDAQDAVVKQAEKAAADAKTSIDLLTTQGGIEAVEVE